MSRKLQYAIDIVRAVRSLADIADVAAERQKEYFDNAYNSAGANEILDSDLTDIDITAADLASAITLLEQFDNFANNSAVTQADYMSTMNKLRRGLVGR